MKRIRFFILILIINLLSGCVQSAYKDNPTTGFTTGRLIFDQSGYYQLSSQTMRKAGLEIQGIEGILLTYKNQPYPFWYESHTNDQNFTIYFFVPEQFDRFLTQKIMQIKTDNNTIQQLVANPLPLEKIATEKIVKKGTILSNIEHELLYLPKTEKADPFLWTEIQNEPFQFNIPVKSDLIENGNLTIKLWSPTSAPVDKDHRVMVAFNGNEPGIYEWEGEGGHDITIPIPTDYSDHSIVLEISSQKPDGVIAQIIYLDQLKIQTTQKLNMQDSIRNVIGNGEYLNFGESDSFGYLLERDDNDNDLSFVEIKPGNDVIVKTRIGFSYDWVPKESMLDEIKIMPVEHHNNILPSQSVDWMVIAPDFFKETLKPLVAHRQEQGISTFLVNPQQLYDEYSGGFPDSQAFTSFFREYFEILGDLPDFVLLVGDYSYERMDYLSAMKFVPSVWVHSDLIGETVSDIPLMDINQDKRPDFVIGRIPVQKTEQLKNWIEKVIASETNLVNAKERQIVSIADNQEEYFTTDAKSFLDGFKFPYTTSAIETLKDKRGVNQLIAEKLQEPVFLMAYFGHGSIDTWGKDKILTVNDVEKLPEQTNFPVFVNLTCLTGYYVHPQQESLTEALLLANEAGAVAVLAPTSLTSAVHQLELQNQLIDALQNPENDQLGEVLMDAWSKMDLEPSPLLEVMQTFGLFGDPAMFLFP